MKDFLRLVLLVMMLALPASPAGAAETITVYKDPT